MESIVRTMTALLLALSFLFVAWVVGWRLKAVRGALGRWVASLAFLAWFLSILFHLLAAVRGFALAPVTVLAGLSAAGAYIMAGGRKTLKTWGGREVVFLRRLSRAIRRSRHRWVVLAFASLATPGLLRALVVPPIGWDTLTYHGVKAGMFIQNGGIDTMEGTGPWGYYRNMPAGGEVFTAWGMLPLRSAAPAGAVEVTQWFGAGLALFVLARLLGAKEPFASRATGFILSLPTLFLLVGSGYVEVGLLAALSSALVLGVSAWEGRRPAAIFLAGGVLGVVAATKISVIPTAALVLAILVALAYRTGGRAARRFAVAGVVAFLLVVSPWLLRTHSRTGAWLSPVPARVGPLVLGVAPPEVEWYMDRPGLRAYDVAAETGVLRRVFRIPGSGDEALGFLALLPLVAIRPGLRQLRARHRGALVLCGAVFLTTLIGYYTPGFSLIRHYWSASSARFLLPAVALLPLVSLCWCRDSSMAARVWGRVMVGATLFFLATSGLQSFTGASGRATSLIALISAAALIAMTLAVRIGRRAVVAPAAACLAIAAVWLGSLQVIQGVYRQELYRLDTAIHDVPKYWVPAAFAVDDPNLARRIAVTSGPFQNLDNWFAAPFLGRSLQNELVYVPVSHDGRICPFGKPPVLEELFRTADPAAWVERLHRRGVTEVVSFAPQSIELVWMESRPDLFRPIVGHWGIWGLFRVAGSDRAW
ncbi:MAG: hypothetical protein KA419_00265 [Acidobacteria bacterium]|nr:hypothetical protein [Acidobacteriota bacterium]